MTPRRTALLVAIPTLFGLSCCCAALALPFGAAGVWGWADRGTAVATTPGTASVSLRVSEWYLGPGEPTYDVLVRRSFGGRIEYQRFYARDVHDRLGISGLSPEGTYSFSVRLADGRGGYYDPGALDFLMLRADETNEVIVVIHGGVDLHGVVSSAADGSVLTDVDVLPEGFVLGRDGMTLAMVYGRTDASGAFAIGGICGGGHRPEELERGVVFRRDGFRERRVHLSFPALCDTVTTATWRVPLEPLASTTMAVAPDLTITRLDPGSPAERAGLRAGDRVVAISGAAVSATTTTQQVIERFDVRDEEIWLTLLGIDGAQRELRTVIHEPDVGG
jgi:hypothetical protein